MIDTKDRILDVAERLFAEQGYAATSMRHVIAEAGVNLAAIHYHFGTKEDLLSELILRRVGPVNKARLALLDQFEAESGDTPVPVERILSAFLEPAAETAALHPQLIKLMGRLHAEGFGPDSVRHHFEPMAKRFIGAMRRALPHLQEQEFFWRLRAAAGAMAFSVGEPPAGAEEMHLRLCGLIAFVAGGLRAPAVTAGVAEVAK